MTKQPPKYNIIYCASDICEARHECARHVSHYEFDDRPVTLADFTNHIKECDHYIEKEEE